MPKAANPLDPQTGRRNRLVTQTLAQDVTNFLQAFRPLQKSGIYPDRPSGQTRPILHCIKRWGMSQAMTVEMNCIRTPDSIALVDDLGERTYKELRDDVWAFAKGLHKRGIGPKDTIAIMARNGRGIMYPFIACGYLGARMMIINPASSGRQVTSMLSEYGADALVMDDEFASSFEIPDGIVTVIGYGEPEGFETMQQLIDEDADIAMPEKARPQPMVLMSSGTTGLPKGVQVRTPKTPRILGGIVDRIPWRPFTTVQLTASMFHGWGLINVNIALGTRSTIIAHRIYDPVQAVDDALKYNVDGIVSSGVFLKSFVDEFEKRGNAKLPNLRFVVAAGNILPQYVYERITDNFGEVMYNFYGTSENNQISIATPSDLRAKPGTVGRPNLGTTVKILNEDGSEVPVGKPGLVHSACSLTFLGYLSPKDKATVRSNTLSTGDLGYIDEDGFLFVYGRADDMVIRGGENVYPKEAEDVIARIPGVDQVHVRGEQNGKVIADVDAWIVRTSDEAGAQLTEDIVKKTVLERLAAHNVPDNVFFVDELPWNDAGKVVRAKLPHPSEFDKSGPGANPSAGIDGQK